MTSATAPRTPPQPIAVTRAQLPLACPRPEDALWNMHPKVYLPIEASGAATCPYCGARYVLST